MERLRKGFSDSLAAAVGKEVPTGPAGWRIAEVQRKWLGFFWPTFTKEAHAGLAEMYVADERFAAYYDDQAGQGAAEFLLDAIAAYVRQ